MAENGEWKPIATGQLGERIRERVDILAKDILAKRPNYLPDKAQVRDPWIALFYAYLWADDKSRDDYEEVVGDLMADAAELYSEVLSPSLYGGGPKAGWLMAHIDREMVDDSADDDDSDEDGEEEEGHSLDEYLCQLLEQTGGQPDYDLISGLVGTGVYGLEVRDKPAGQKLVEVVVDKLHDRHVRESGHITWHTPPETLPTHQRVAAPDGYFNLGLAHGVPGVVAFLAMCIEYDVATEKASELLSSTVDWILSKRVPGVAGGGFDSSLPGSVESGGPVRTGRNRTAWCYGSLGISAALLLTARCVGNREWEEHAIDIGLATAQVPWESAGVRDPALCHGDVGNAHIYNRLYQATGQEAFREAALRYFEHAFTFVDDTKGIGGFQEYGVLKVADRHEDMELSWYDGMGFLTGSSGIGLGLLAAISDVEPQWDRLLMVNVPPQKK